MEVKVYATLRDVVGGKSTTLNGDGARTMRAALDELIERYPELGEKLFLPNGEMHSAFHFLVNGRDARYLDGLDTIISPTDDIRIFPPVGGGK